MDQKRENTRSDNRRPRRKKRKKSGSGDPDKQGAQVNQTGSPAKRPQPQKPGQQNRSKEPQREKPRRPEPVSAAPRDLRLASPKKEKAGRENPPFHHVVRRYGVVIYDTFAAAKADKETIAAKAKDFDQYNVVIRAEGNMDDPDLLTLGPVKIFAGAAWALIHERRLQDGWYEGPR